MSPYWTLEEEHRLIELFQSGMPIEKLCESFNRSPEALKLKLRRLGLKFGAKISGEQKDTRTTTTHRDLPEIKPGEELLTMEEMLKLLMGAIELLKKPGVSGLELKRCRLIVTTARSYLSMLEIYEDMTGLEQRIIDMEARILEVYRNQLLTVEDPEEKKELEEKIKEMEEGLAKQEHYKPFQPKPSLI